ncbi:MAG: molecular chaperone TorD family protein [Chloroflexota bacterium]
MSASRRGMAELALRRADLYGLLSGVFSSPPSPELLAAVKSGDMEDLARALELPGVPELFRTYRERLAGSPEEAALEELAIDWTRLVRPIGQIKPPYEGLYRSNPDSGETILQIKKAYRQSGMLPDESTGEPPDFLGIELDFMRRLCLREHECRKSGAGAAALFSEEESFLREHLGEWVAVFCAGVGDYVTTDFYRAFLRLLEHFVAEELKFLTGAVS